MVKPNSFSRDNWGVAIATILGSSAIGLFSAASVQIEDLKGISPYQSQKGEWIGMSRCFSGVDTRGRFYGQT